MSKKFLSWNKFIGMRFGLGAKRKQNDVYEKSAKNAKINLQ